MSYHLTTLDELEAEAIHILREVMAEFDRPVMLYSVGKDSSVMVHLARKAFYPGRIPFPLLHVDTGYKFSEMYRFRDQFVKEINADLIVYRHPKVGDEQVNPYLLGTTSCCSLLKTQALLNALREGQYDAAFGGARREEERSRAKERVFSFRDQYGQWDPKSQRPELWNLYNAAHKPGDHFRVFPLSNWTELDIWLYILREQIPVVPLYFAKQRKVLRRNHLLLPLEGTQREANDEIIELSCRYRTLGCIPCTGAIASDARDISAIIEELLDSDYSERITRVIDHDRDGSMELKKREGYF